MLQAVALAGRARWQTCPNPCVGALLVRENIAVASGWHKGPGLPHAEAEALEDARAKGVNPAECTMVVTLEPCRHFGQTPPCTEAILESGVSRVIVGALDPNPEASGGAELLRSRGLTVETGVAERECLDSIDDFFVWQTTDLPYTVLKLASTLDGRIATRAGHSKWITSPGTRAKVHELRRHMQALIIGGNTFYQDDPQLTCRPEGAAGPCPGQPLAVVVTSRLPEAELSLHLLKERPEQTIFWTTVAAAASPKAEALRRKGVRVIGLSSHARPDRRGHSMRAELNLAEGLAYLRRELDCRYVLCEGGGLLGLSLLDKGLAREFHLHLAPKIIGDNEAMPLFDGRAPVHIDESLRLRITETAASGDDMAITLRPAMPPVLSVAQG